MVGTFKSVTEATDGVFLREEVMVGERRQGYEGFLEGGLER